MTDPLRALAEEIVSGYLALAALHGGRRQPAAPERGLD